MPDSKQIRWVDDYGTDAKSEIEKSDADVPSALPAANDADGWQQYRRWISKAPAPRGRRVGVDPSVYTWKGYRNWTDEVKRNWSKDHNNESD